MFLGTQMCIGNKSGHFLLLICLMLICLSLQLGELRRVAENLFFLPMWCGALLGEKAHFCGIHTLPWCKSSQHG